MRRTFRLALAAALAATSLVSAGSASAIPPSPIAITWPVEGATVNSLPLTYNLPEDALAGSVRLFFRGAASRTLVLKNNTAGTPTIKLALSNLAASSGVASVSGGDSLPDGTYSVTLAYQDASFNPKASSVRSFTIDTQTLTPTLISPTPGAAASSDILGVSFTLPEAALAGSVKILLHPTAGGNGDHVVTLDSYGVSNGQVALFRPNPSFALGVLRVAPAGAVLPGIYDVTISYQDAVGNLAATNTAGAINLGGWVPAPGRTTIAFTKPNGGKLKVGRDKAAVAISLNGAGTVKLDVRSARGAVLGTGNVRFAAAGRKTVTVTLNAAGRKAFRKAGRAGLKVTLAASGTATGRTAGKAALAVKLVS